MFHKNKPKKEMDMLNGPMWKNILIFAIPIALTTLMQQLFHSADMAVVGRFCGENELAAVGSNNAIINLLVNLFMGFSAGSNVVIAQLLGGKKLKTANKAVHTSLLVAAISGIMVMILGVIFSPLMLKLISSPPEVIGLATLYLRIYFIGIPPLMIYNFASAILRSRGETTKPFYCLVIGGIFNVILNLIFVIGFNWSVAGVAIATSVSNLVSCILIIKILLKEEGALKLNFKDLNMDRFLLSKIFKIGLPMGIQSCLFPVSNMVVQSAINSLGTTMIAGNAAAMSLETYSWSFNGAFSQAAVSFVSQNYGAKNLKRCKTATWQVLTTALVVCSLFNLLMYVFLDPLISLFTTDSTVIEIAKDRLIFMYIVFATGVVMDNLSSSLRGLGYSVVPTIVTVLGVCVLRIAWIKIVFAKVNTFMSVLVVYPISWLFVGAILTITTIVIYKKLNKKQEVYI